MLDLPKGLGKFGLINPWTKRFPGPQMILSDGVPTRSSCPKMEALGPQNYTNNLTAVFGSLYHHVWALGTLMGRWSAQRLQAAQGQIHIGVLG